MKKGTQICCTPPHADGNIFHPDAEFGFVVRPNKAGDAHFCRYWIKGKLGELRTKANSECTPDDCLHIVKSVSQKTVEHTIKEYQIE